MEPQSSPELPVQTTRSATPWQHQAKILLERIEKRCHTRYGVGSMSGSIYDSAWVSMVRRKTDSAEWVFPEAFNYVYRSQLEDGGWTAYGDPVDRLMNTLASLISLVIHKETPLWPGSESDIAERINRAKDFLHTRLAKWDVQNTDYVSFEVLIPSMLEELERHGISFTFPGRKYLWELNEKKMSQFFPSIVYLHKTTVLHCLEGFIGRLDFDKLRHHIVDGHLMASPSSTAAYLMNCTEWDYDAEDYLRHVIQNSRPFEEGLVPAAFPTTHFEVSWVLSCLLENGFRKEDLDCYALEKLAGILEQGLYQGDGVIGFAPGVEGDADDTAKAIIVLRALGRKASPEALVHAFESENHFRTYKMERNASVTANCNVLLALLHSEDPEIYTSQVAKCASYIMELWWTADGKFPDKWHLSMYYPFMLIAQSFMKLLDLCGNGHFQDEITSIINYKLPIMLLQICNRILMTQAEDGSFGQNNLIEETCYGVIALANLVSFPLIGKSPISPQVYQAIADGRTFLRNNGALNVPYLMSKDFLWVEKVTYASDFLHNAYILGALQVPVPAHDFGTMLDRLVIMPFEKVKIFSKFYTQLPLFKQLPPWQIKASLMEGYLFLPRLAKVKNNVFDRKGCKEDKYFEYIPFSWVGPTNAGRTLAGPGLLYDLMMVALLNYQVDEYIEGLIGVEYRNELNNVLLVVNALFDNEEANDEGTPRRVSFAKSPDNSAVKSPVIDPTISEDTPLSPEAPGRGLGAEDYASLVSSPTSVDIPPTPTDQEVAPVPFSPRFPSASSDYASDEDAPHSSSEGKSPTGKASTNSPIIPTEGNSLRQPILEVPIPAAGPSNKPPHSKFPPHLLPIYERLSIFVFAILNHPHIQNASAYDRAYLTAELRAYLVSQVNQGLDNERLRAQTDRRTLHSPPSTYLKWTRGRAGEHVSCHYAFAFLTCLLSHKMGGKDCFPDEETKYMSQAALSHLAALSRMYNDLGSVIRDRDEGNLNSINFPEFQASAQGRADKELKESLLRIAEFERECFEMSMDRLEKMCGKVGRAWVASVVRMYARTVDYYGQLYVLRDMTCRI